MRERERADEVADVVADEAAGGVARTATRGTPRDDHGSFALALSECEDELALRERAARRHQLLALLPGVGVTTFWITTMLLGVGSPAGVLSTIFGIVTAREGKKQVDHQRGLRGCRERLDALRAGAEDGDGPAGVDAGEEPREEPGGER